MPLSAHQRLEFANTLQHYRTVPSAVGVAIATYAHLLHAMENDPEASDGHLEITDQGRDVALFLRTNGRRVKLATLPHPDHLTPTLETWADTTALLFNTNIDTKMSVGVSDGVLDHLAAFTQRHRWRTTVRWDRLTPNMYVIIRKLPLLA